MKLPQPGPRARRSLWQPKKRQVVSDQYPENQTGEEGENTKRCIKMYNVAFVENEKCVAQKGCRLCIMYCPEADCIKLDTRQVKAYVVIDKCKGCELCVVVCDAAKHNAIMMAPVDGKTGAIILGKGKAEAAALGQAYQG